MSNLIKNQVHNVIIQSYNSEAMGVCRIDGQAVFVPGTIEGENWEIKLVKVGSAANYARAENVLIASDMRILPECPQFGKCGGCDTWHMKYEEELRFKLNKVNNARSGGYRTERHSEKKGCSGCDMCTGLICADCCCECFGGDLIPCC